jgi:hypothetical protein
MVNPYKGCGRAVWNEVKRRHWSVAEAARLLGISRTMLYRIKDDLEWKPTTETVQGVLDGLGWTVAEFHERGLEEWRKEHPGDEGEGSLQEEAEKRVVQLQRDMDELRRLFGADKA